MGKHLIEESSFQRALSRRLLLKSFVAASAMPVLANPWSIAKALESDSEGRVAFLFVTDTHYLAQKDNPGEMDKTSAQKCSRLVEVMNAFDGDEIPEHAGGGRVSGIKGVIHGGDVVDSADKRGDPFDEMQVTEFSAFESDYGLDGKDGLLQYPVYEVHGNHDGPHADTHVVKGIMRRNKSRVGVDHVSDSGLHYAWSWGGVRFINLGIVVGESGEHLQQRRYEPLGSLEFLRADVKEKLSGPDQPIVITQHINVSSNSLPYSKDEDRFLHQEWHPQDVKSFYETIRSYNVVADFHGHTHARDVFSWVGTQDKAELDKEGVAIFNGDNSSHFHDGRQAFLYVEISPKALLVREVASKDGWKSYAWSKKTWGRRLV